MSAFPLLPTRSDSPRDRALAAATNDAIRALITLANVADEYGAGVVCANATSDANKYEALLSVEMSR